MIRYFITGIFSLVIFGIALSQTKESKDNKNNGALKSKESHYLFTFGNAKSQESVNIPQFLAYSKETGYGFDYGTHPEILISPKGKGIVTSNQPFYFSVALPEGNYRITLTMGNPDGESENMVRAESRRLFIEECKTAKGEMVTRTFTVNIRTPKIGPSDSIRIKPREKGFLNWDEKLTLEFTGKKPCIQSISIENAPEVTTVFLAGNSTVVDQDKEPWAAWGQMIPRFFTKDVAIANYAESGESLSSFKSAHRLQKILSIMKPGDYLFVEFGHNDQKQKGPGIGPWDSYTKLFKEFIESAKAKGGIPVVVTSVCRRNFDSTAHVINTLGDFPEAARKVAHDENVALIDLNAMSKILYEAWGPEKSVKAFVHYPANTFPGQDQPLADNTHFNTYGAYEISKCIIEGIKINNLGLVKYLTPDYKGFNPASPDPVEDWSWPLSPMVTNIKPDGN
jgi:lysophospholipase L1-like esterase